MAITCPSCGMENSDTATECRRCRAALAESPAQELSGSLGQVCGRCEAYNEPGATRCSTCGYKLTPEAPKPAPASDLPAPASSIPTFADEEPGPPGGGVSLSDELSALALSAEEAADAGLQIGNGAPPAPEIQPLAAEVEPPPPVRKQPQVEAAAVGGAAVGWSPPPPLFEPNAREDAPPPSTPPVAARKTCANCGAENPPAAKFCFECGTPFAGSAPRTGAKIAPLKPSPPPEPPPTVSVQLDEGFAQEAPESWAASTDPTGQTAQPTDESAPGEAPLSPDDIWASLPAEPPAEAMAIAEVGDETPPPEPEPPYHASLVVERGPGVGTTYLLGRIENVLGGAGAPIEIPEDPHLAPRVAAIVFEEERLLLRDEGSANGVYVKVRESSPLEPGDLLIAGERLLRFDGPCELPVGESTETPYLGSPRPQGAVVRLSEVLRGGKTGRTCFRAGPVIAIGRTGCDLNFPGDQQLGARHAEVRLAEDGSASVVDLGSAPGGVFVRLRPQQSHELQAGDVLQLGDQQLRVEVG